MSNGHSILPPSGAAAWRRCPMWVTMNQLYPNNDTPESLEGNAAHWVFAEMLYGNQITEGAISPQGVFVTDEMIEGAELFCDVVHKHAQGLDLNIELNVPCTYLHPQCHGTPDVWAFNAITGALYIFDYKFGHRFVDEYENDQLVAYYSGILDVIAEHLDVGSGILDDRLTVNFIIVQPRCYYAGSPVRTWTVRGSDLRGQVVALQTAAAKALSPDPVAVTNSGCRDCPGRHACAALQKAAYSDAEFAVTSAPVQLSPSAASLELKMLERAHERLTARIGGLSEQVLTYVKSGERVPYHKAKQGYGRQRWSVPDDQVIAMGQLMGVDISVTKPVTPKQAVVKGIDETVINSYSEIPSGKVTLVPDTPADARRVFGVTTI